MKTQDKVSYVKAYPDAANRLGIKKTAINVLLSKGLFTVKRINDGGDRYLLSDELDLYIETVGTPEDAEEALREFRLRKKRIKK